MKRVRQKLYLYLTKGSCGLDFRVRKNLYRLSDGEIVVELNLSVAELLFAGSVAEIDINIAYPNTKVEITVDRNDLQAGDETNGINMDGESR